MKLSDDFLKRFQSVFPPDKHSFEFENSIFGLSSLIDRESSEEEARAALRAMSGEIRKKISGDPAPREKINLFNSVFFGEWGFTCDSQADSFFAGKIKKENFNNSHELFEYLSIPRVTKNKTGISCTIGLIYLMLAESLYIPVYGVVSTVHFILRYDDGDTKFDINIMDKGALRESPKAVRDEIIYGKTLEHYHSAGIYLTKIAKLLESENLHNEAAPLLKRAVEINPDFAETHYITGHSAYMQNNPALAEEKFKKAVDLNPVYAEAYFSLGVVCYKTGKKDEAIAWFKKATGIRPDFAEAHYIMGMIHASEKRIEEAKEHFAETLELNPEHTDAFYKLGLLYYAERDMARAEAAFTKITQINPAYAPAWLNLGLIYEGRKQHSDAEKFLQKAVELSPENHTYKFYLGSLYYSAGNYGAAAEYFSKAAESRTARKNPL